MQVAASSSEVQCLADSDSATAKRNAEQACLAVEALKRFRRCNSDELEWAAHATDIDTTARQIDSFRAREQPNHEKLSDAMSNPTSASDGDGMSTDPEMPALRDQTEEEFLRGDEEWAACERFAEQFG